MMHAKLQRLLTESMRAGGDPAVWCDLLRDPSAPFWHEQEIPFAETTLADVLELYAAPPPTSLMLPLEEDDGLRPFLVAWLAFIENDRELSRKVLAWKVVGSDADGWHVVSPNDGWVRTDRPAGRVQNPRYSRESQALRDVKYNVLEACGTWNE